MILFIILFNVMQLMLLQKIAAKASIKKMILEDFFMVFR